MKFKGNIYIILSLFLFVEFTNAGSFCLNFNPRFLSLLRQQEKRYLFDFSREKIDEAIKKSKDIDKYLTESMCYNDIPRNLGETNVFGEKAYVYIQAQGRAIVFEEIYCDKIKKTLLAYLEKTFAEYKAIIFYYKLSPTALGTTEEEYGECQAFMDFFTGNEDEPLKKLDNIFKKATSASCSIQ